MQFWERFKLLYIRWSFKSAACLMLICAYLCMPTTNFQPLIISIHSFLPKYLTKTKNQSYIFLNPSVIRLPFHLPGQQHVIYEEFEEI
ncbi:hypothetical protein HanIR_Chr08g0370661 [Helianthus annuus]|nr:hypothetical protein HanIR_Chr08g0370661 [Helianthus annuus]